MSGRPRIFSVHAAIFLSCIPLLAPPSFGAGIAETLPINAVFQAKERIIIPVGPKTGDAALEFPAFRGQEGQVLCIRFRACLFMSRPGGWNPYLRLTLNDKVLGPVTSGGSDRLLNRGQVFRNTYNGVVGWWGGVGSQSLMTFFGPGSGEMDSRVISAREEGYWYVLDISDAANYIVIGADDRIESSTPNKLVFTNTYCALDTGEPAVCHEMRIEDITIGYVPRTEVEKLQPLSAKPVPALKGEVLGAPGSTLTVARSGAMQLKIGRETYSFSSAYSYPGTTIGYHLFSWDAQPDADWKTRFSRDKQKPLVSVGGDSKRYSVARTVKYSAGRFLISDTVENKTAEPLGMSIRYEVIAPKRFGPGDVYFAGNADVQTLDACAVNPTVFVRQSGSSAGVVVEDNVLRLQMAALNNGNAIQFGTEHFGLAPRQKYTVEWTIYPSRDRDYFAFINRVRRDWKVNITIPGPFAFSEGDVIPSRKIELYAVPPWFEYATGSGMSKEEFKKILQPKLAKLYAAQPDAVTLGMIETNLIAVERKTIPGSEILPPSDRAGGRGTYGLECTAEQTKLFEKSPWFDCMLKTADGRVLIDTYYPDKDFVDLMVYPAPGNYQLRFLLDEIDYLMDEVGFKGIYIDQFTLAVRGLGQKDRCDFSKWDGHTVDLNERGEIARKYTDASLVGAPARRTIIKHILDKGGVVVTNGHSVVRETTGLPCLNFQETEWVSYNPVEHLQDEPPILGDMAAGHLDTPIGLGIRPARFGDEGKEHLAEIIHKWVITCLKNGQLYYYYESRIPAEGPGSGEYGAINHMFPFTPVELHSGWLVGKERIITAKSGTFVWNHPGKPTCLLFDLKGRPNTPEVRMVQRGKAWDVTVKLADWCEIAVIE